MIYQIKSKLSEKGLIFFMLLCLFFALSCCEKSGTSADDIKESSKVSINSIKLSYTDSKALIRGRTLTMTVKGDYEMKKSNAILQVRIWSGTRTDRHESLYLDYVNVSKRYALFTFNCSFTVGGSQNTATVRVALFTEVQGDMMAGAYKEYDVINNF